MSLNEEPPKPAAPEAVAEPSADESAISADLRASQVLEREATKDAFLEKEDLVVPKAAEAEGPVEQRVAVAEAVPVAAAPQDPVTVDVTKILEDGLGEYYQAMPDAARERFQKKGKEVSVELAKRVRTFRVVVKDVLRLVYDWLKTIPSVNKFFLEQEAKIKTDRILQYADEQKAASRNSLAP